MRITVNSLPYCQIAVTDERKNYYANKRLLLFYFIQFLKTNLSVSYYTSDGDSCSPPFHIPGKQHLRLPIIHPRQKDLSGLYFQIHFSVPT